MVSPYHTTGCYALKLYKAALIKLTPQSTEPPLSPPEKAIVKSYGGWTHFLMCFGLKPWNQEDEDEGVHILRSFVAGDEEERKEEERQRQQGGGNGN